MANINANDIKDLINNAEVLCETIKDKPAGCEACYLFDEDNDNFECPLHQTINKIKEQF